MTDPTPPNDRSPFAPPSAQPEPPIADPSAPTPGYGGGPSGVGTPPPGHGPASGGAGAPARRRGLGIAATVLGGVALLLAAIPFVNVLSPILALVGVVLGVIALVQRAQSTPIAIVGTSLSVLAGIVSLVMITVFTVGAVGGLVQELERGGPVAEAPIEDEGDGGETAAPGTEPGTREDPVPINTPVVFSAFGEERWELVVGETIQNVDAEVADGHPSNEPPADGMQYAALPVSAMNIGDEPGRPWFDLDFAFVTADGQTYDESGTFVIVDDHFRDVNDLYPGANAQGYVIIEVPSDGVEAGTWRVSPIIGDEAVFFAQS